MKRFLAPLLFATGLLAEIVATAPAEAGTIAYVTTGDPWGVTDNQTALDAAFGAGNWSQFDYSNAISSGVFSGTYDFVWLEGGDGVGPSFTTFVSGNIPLLESWVAAGGSLAINAARWEGGSDSIGFGLTLNWAGTGHDYDGMSTAAVVAPLNPIFNGVSANSFTGNFFAHDSISGSGFTTLMTNGIGETILAEKTWGSGYLLVSGLTSPGFQQPSTDASQLRQNMFTVGAEHGNASAVPEPGPIALLSIGLLAVGFAMRKHRGDIASPNGAAAH